MFQNLCLNVSKSNYYKSLIEQDQNIFKFWVWFLGLVFNERVNLHLTSHFLHSLKMDSVKLNGDVYT